MVHMFYGGNGLSWLRYICISSFKIQYPDIPLKLWVSKEYNLDQKWESEEVQEFNDNEDRTIHYFDLLKEAGVEIIPWEQPQEVTDKFGLLDPVHQADIFRYHILSTEGGWFADTDILFMNNSLESMILEKKDAVCYYGDYPIGFIGGKGEGSIWGKVYNKCLTQPDTGYQSFGAPLIKEMWFTVPPHTFNIEKGWFYHYDHHDIYMLWHREVDISCLPGIHIYCGSAMTQLYNRLLTEDNYKEYPCTVTNAIKEILNERD